MQLKVKGMQLKVKDMQLKVGMQKKIGERGSRRDICSLPSSLVSFTPLYSLVGYSLHLSHEGKKNLLYLYQKIKKILSCHTYILSYPLYHDSYSIKESSIWK